MAALVGLPLLLGEMALLAREAATTHIKRIIFK
jgi:hypothetical protein